jgi:tRNA A37 methylthiotransferase MiaB
VRRYHITTFGCQMNAHDSERIKGLLEELGLGEAASLHDPRKARHALRSSHGQRGQAEA